MATFFIVNWFYFVDERTGIKVTWRLKYNFVNGSGDVLIEFVRFPPNGRVQGGVCATCITYKPLPATTQTIAPLPREGM
jgi:hypothetical protein